jgi:quercetin dioxygenase-like cupin family protein
MPWTDYEKGHIFMVEDRVITDYRAGDVFMFENPGAWHGAVNIGHSPRAILQITDYKISRNLDIV